MVPSKHSGLCHIYRPYSRTPNYQILKSWLVLSNRDKPWREQNAAQRHMYIVKVPSMYQCIVLGDCTATFSERNRKEWQIQDILLCTVPRNRKMFLFIWIFLVFCKIPQNSARSGVFETFQHSVMVGSISWQQTGSCRFSSNFCTCTPGPGETAVSSGYCLMQSMLA